MMLGLGLDFCMVSVLKLQQIVACQKKDQTNRADTRLDCFFRSGMIRIFPVSYSYKHFMNSSPDNQHFICGKKEKSVHFQKMIIIWASLIDLI